MRPAILLGTTLAVAACTGDDPAAPIASRLLVTPPAVQLFVGETFVARASLWDDSGNPLAGSVTWTSSDTTVLTVTAGRLHALAPGSVHVTASGGGLEDTVEAAVVAVLPLAFPLRGTLNTDFWIDWGVPHTGSGGTTDVLCGPKVVDDDYHGGVPHQGVDFALKDMMVMDTGVAVYAAASGTVETVHDGEPDRNVWFRDSSPPSNHVVLDHGDGLRTVYGSLRSNSIAVSVGQEVPEGTLLGEVGSSGLSQIAHLHFEVQLDGRAVDPYEGPCGSGPRLWRDSLAFDGDVHFIRAHVSDWPEPGPRHYKLQVPGPADTIVVGRQITPWAQQMLVEPGVSVGFRIIDPQGDVRLDRRRIFADGWPTFYYADAPFMSDTITTAGPWVMEYWYDGQVLVQDTFVLVVPE